MPRSRGGGASRRPSVSASKRPSGPTQQQTRPTSTTAAGADRNMPQQSAQQKGPGLFGQMASTAAGVAVGSSIGHAVGSMFGGGSTEATEASQEASPMASDYSTAKSNNWAAASCDGPAQGLTQCLNENGGNMQICNYYLEQLKNCQAAAARY